MYSFSAPLADVFSRFLSLFSKIHAIEHANSFELYKYKNFFSKKIAFFGGSSQTSSG